MKTQNTKHKTKLFLLFSIISFSMFFSCKRVIDTDDIINESKSIDIKNKALIDKGEKLRKKFIAKKLMKNAGDTFSIDSGIYYLDIALNIQLSNANSYLVEQDNFEKTIELNENQNFFTELELATIFINTKNFTDSIFSTIVSNNKIVNSISIKRLPIEDDYTQRKLAITIIIGRTLLNDEIYNLYKTEPIVYFPNSTNLRFNYNGGFCSQAYTDFFWTGPHGGQQVDIHGNILGYPTGAAIELEKAINKCYSAKSILPIAVQPNGSKIIYLPDVDMVTNTTLQPWEFPLANNQINIYGPHKHNPTRIFSFNDWSVSIFSNVNVCLDGGMLNYYLNHAMDIIEEAKVIYPLGNNFVFRKLYVNGNMKLSGSGPTTNIFERSYNWNYNSSIATPNTWGSPSNDYYTYFKHTYRLFKAIPVVVADPNKM